MAGGRTGRSEVRPAVLRTSPPATGELKKDRDRALALTPVSRETTERLDRFVDLLLDWQRRVNLIAPSTEPTLWTRHISDSLQLLDLAPDARVWADFGSGAGFPGMAIACALADRPGGLVHLVESNTKKAAFLREAVRATDAPALVHAVRVADFVKQAPPEIEVVTARALAPLPELLEAAYPLLKKGVIGVFPKGQGAAAELTQAAKCRRIQETLAASRTDPKAQIILVRSLEPILGSQAKRNSTKR
jgi:16S rRNA (guanine527-N7)-methyltransferase